MLRASNTVNYDKFSVVCQKLDMNENEGAETYLDVCKVDVVVINQVIITLSVSLYFSLFLFVSLPLCLSVTLSLCLSVTLSLCLSFSCLSVSLSAYLSVCLFAPSLFLSFGFK